MDTPARFPLKRLPSLAIEEVISTMLPFELYNFSKVSTACRLVVQSFSKNRTHKHYLIHVSNMKHPTIDFEYNRVFWCWEMTNEIEKDGTQVSENEYNRQYETVYVYCGGENLMKKCIEMFMYIKQVFNVGIDYLYIRLWEFKEQLQTILDWLLVNFPTIFYISVNCENEPVGLLEHTLNSLTNTKYVHIAGRTVENCAYSVPERFDKITISDPDWIKVEHLMRFKASKINILHAKLTDADLNAFLKSWINMDGLRNLKDLETTISSPDLQNVLQDVPHRLCDPGKSPRRGSCFHQQGEGVEIDRKDGVVASIFVYRVHDFYMMVMTTPLDISL